MRTNDKTELCYRTCNVYERQVNPLHLKEPYYTQWQVLCTIGTFSLRANWRDNRFFYCKWQIVEKTSYIIFDITILASSLKKLEYLRSMQRTESNYISLKSSRGSRERFQKQAKSIATRTTYEEVVFPYTRCKIFSIVDLKCPSIFRNLQVFAKYTPQILFVCPSEDGYKHATRVSDKAGWTFALPKKYGE